MKRINKTFLVVVGLLLAITARAEGELTLAVSEGTSGGLDHARVIAKYGGLAEVIGHAVKRRVQVVFAREFSALDEGMKSGRFDLVMARPSDYPARGVRDHGYQFVASARPDGQCLVITTKGSLLKSLDQAKGARWVMPEQASYMTKLCNAELRDRGILMASENVKYVREQAAVIFYLDQKLADVGTIASYSGPAKALEKSGHLVLHRSVAQPYFPLVAGARVTPEEVRAIQGALSTLDQSPAGRTVLQTVGVKGFDTGSGERLKALLAWLGL